MLPVREAPHTGVFASPAPSRPAFALPSLLALLAVSVFAGCSEARSVDERNPHRAASEARGVREATVGAAPAGEAPRSPTG